MVYRILRDQWFLDWFAEWAGGFDWDLGNSQKPVKHGLSIADIEEFVSRSAVNQRAGAGRRAKGEIRGCDGRCYVRWDGNLPARAILRRNVRVALSVTRPPVVTVDSR